MKYDTTVDPPADRLEGSIFESLVDCELRTQETLTLILTLLTLNLTLTLTLRVRLNSTDPCESQECC
jgi:hypothetical protein